MKLEQTHQRCRSVETIHDIVSAMRAIAAGRIQSAQRALLGARHYQEVVERGLAAVLDGRTDLPLPAPGKTTVLYVLTSEQPLCGAFNQNVLALAERRWSELRQGGEVELVAVGHRGARQLVAHGIRPDHIEAAATSPHGLRDLVKRLAALADRCFAAGELRALHVIYSRYQSVSEQIPSEERLLPPDLPSPPAHPAPARAGPYHRYLSVPVLLAGLVGEYTLIRLFRIAAEAFASEQASRLIAMDGATQNTKRMLRSLQELERRERQEQITQQVLELSAARLVRP